MSTQQRTGQQGAARQDLFVRQATGLVRDVSGGQQIAFNYIAAIPPLILASSLFFALSGFPGGNILIAILLTLPLTLTFAYSFGLMSAVIPRSGGDYVIVSRVLHPAAGVVSSCCTVLACALGCGFGAQAFVTIGLAPGLSTIGLVSGNDRLVNWGTTLSTSKGWQFALGAVALALSAIVISVGWRWTKRLLFGLLAISMVGLVVCAIVALVTSKASFIADFNGFAQPFTETPTTYQDTIAGAAKGGIDVRPEGSFANTLAMVGVIGSFSIYFWGTAFIAGEIRQGGSAKSAHRMALAGFLVLTTIAVISAVFLASWGRDFLTAAYGGGLPEGLSVLPSYVFLTSAEVGNSIIAWLLVITFLGAFIASNSYLMVELSRSLFAWSVDGVLPRRISAVSGRNAPVTAVMVTLAVCLLAYLWGIYVADSLLQVLVYSTLIQLVAMGLVAISGLVLPHRHRALYQGSSSNKEMFGIPILQVVGCLALVAIAIMYYVYFHFDYFGLTNKGLFFVWLLATIAVGLGIYYAARAARASSGVGLDVVYGEIPPE